MQTKSKQIKSNWPFTKALGISKGSVGQKHTQSRNPTHFLQCASQPSLWEQKERNSTQPKGSKDDRLSELMHFLCWRPSVYRENKERREREISGVQENKCKDYHLAFSFVVLSLQSWSFSVLQNLYNHQAVKTNKPHPKQTIIIIKITIKQLIVLLYCQAF